MTHPYAAEDYLASLAPDQPPARVEGWGTWVLTRPIAGGGRDAAGAYPRAAIAPDADLAAGLDDLRAAGLVSVVAVPDPLFAPGPEALGKAFSLCRPFKTHLIIERAKTYSPNKHHRYEIKRAQVRCRVEIVRLADHLAGWTALYGGLIERHDITGLAAFGQAYFEYLARHPDFVTFAAYVGDDIAAMAIWVEHAGVAYNHLGASAALGYANGASYAIYDAAIGHFGGAEVFDLGGAAGSSDDPNDGLARFKRGFANAETTAYLCGAVLDEVRYAELSAGKPGGFFPAYRA